MFLKRFPQCFGTFLKCFVLAGWVAVRRHTTTQPGGGGGGQGRPTYPNPFPPNLRHVGYVDPTPTPPPTPLNSGSSATLAQY